MIEESALVGVGEPGWTVGLSAWVVGGLALELEVWRLLHCRHVLPSLVLPLCGKPALVFCWQSEHVYSVWWACRWHVGTVCARQIRCCLHSGHQSRAPGRCCCAVDWNFENCLMSWQTHHLRCLQMINHRHIRHVLTSEHTETQHIQNREEH